MSGAEPWTGSNIPGPSGLPMEADGSIPREPESIAAASDEHSFKDFFELHRGRLHDIGDLLAPHDISLALALAGERPEEVSARGEAFLRPGVEDVVFGYLHFPSGLVAHLHVSWLDPHKRRMLTVVGSEGMAVFDDTEADRKLTVYEKASSPSRFDTWGEFQALRTGDVLIPQVSNSEPLIQETKAFVAAVRRGSATVASGDEGLAVVEVLTALQASLEQRGAPIRLDSR